MEIKKPANKEVLKMQPFQAKRVHRTHETVIQAPVDTIFPLACPIEEYKWIDGWQCQMIYSDGGKNENNCIFSEEMSAPALFPSAGLGPTVWYTTLWNPADHRVHFALITRISVAKFEIEMHAQGDGGTRVQWNYTVTAVNAEGNRHVNDTAAAGMDGMMAFLAGSLKHYFETGEILRGGGN
jgi:hypothetical protein